MRLRVLDGLDKQGVGARQASRTEDVPAFDHNVPFARWQLPINSVFCRGPDVVAKLACGLNTPKSRVSRDYIDERCGQTQERSVVVEVVDGEERKQQLMYAPDQLYLYVTSPNFTSVTILPHSHHLDSRSPR